MVTREKVQRLCDLRTQAELAKAEYEEHEKRHRALEREVWDELAESGTKTIKFELGDPYGEVRIEKRETIRARIINRDALLDALETAGRTDEMVFTDIRKAPLNELIRTCLEQGVPLPEGSDFSSTKYVQIAGRNSA